MKSKYILLIIIVGVLLVIYRIYDDFETNSRFQFSSTNVKAVHFLLKRDLIPLESTIYNELSKALMTGERKKIKQFSIERQPLESVDSLVIVLDKGTLIINRGDDNQIYVVSSKVNGLNKKFEYKSAYLLGLLDDLYRR